MENKAPLFAEIAAMIRANIDSGVYQKGSAIPSEPALAKLFNTTRMTVRRAIDELVGKGLLYRVQGSGTFVSHLDLQKSYQNHGFTGNMLSLGVQPSSRVLTFTECDPPAHVAKSLLLAKNERVFYLKRIRLADLEPIAVEQVWLSAARFARLAGRDFSRCSLYNTLREEYALEAGYSHQKLNARHVEGEVAEILFGQAGGIALHVRSVDYDHSLTPITANDSFYHGEKYTLDVIIK